MNLEHLALFGVSLLLSSSSLFFAVRAKRPLVGAVLAALPVAFATLVMAASAGLGLMARRAYLSRFPYDSVLESFSIIQETIAQGAELARAPALLGAAIAAPACVVGLLAAVMVNRRHRRNWMLLLSCATALPAAGAGILGVRAATFGDRVVADSLAAIRPAADADCDVLANVLAARPLAEVEVAIPSARAHAQKCVADALSRVDDPAERAAAELRAQIARATRPPSAPPVSGNPLVALSESALLVDPAQEAEIRKRLAGL